MIYSLRLLLFHFLFRPFCYTFIKHIHQIFPFYHLWQRLLSLSYCRKFHSPTGTKCHNLFSFQIIKLQKCTDNHWLFIPPDWIRWCQVRTKNFNFFLLYCTNSLHKCLMPILSVVSCLKTMTQNKPAPLTG